MGKTVCFLYARTEYRFLENLDYCINDLDELYNAVHKFLDVPRECIRKYTNLSNSDYINQLNAFINLVDEDDTCILYHTSHGTIQDDELILCNNESNDNSQDGIFISAYFNILEKLKSKKNIVLLDCCHSGNAVYKKDFLFTNSIKNKLDQGTTVITSCQDNQYSNPYNSSSNYIVSAFTKFIVYALRAHYVKGVNEIFISDLYDLISIYSKIWYLKKKIEQQPTYVTNSLGTLSLLINEEMYDENNMVKLVLDKPYRIYENEYSGIKKIKDKYAHAINAKILIEDGDSNLGEFLEAISIKLIESYSTKFDDNIKEFIVFLYIATDILELRENHFKYRSIYLTERDSYWYNSLGKSIEYHNNLAFTYQSWIFAKDVRESSVEEDEYFIMYWDELMPKLMCIFKKCSDGLNRYLKSEITYDQLEKIFKMNFPIIHDKYLKAGDRNFTLPFSIVKEYNDKAYQYLTSLDNLLLAFELKYQHEETIRYIETYCKRSENDFDEYSNERNKLIELELIKM